MSRKLLAGLLITLLLASIGARAEGQSTIPAASLSGFAFDQHPGAALPLDTGLRDENGRAVKLQDFFGSKPVLLAFEYFRCPGLCGLVLDGLAASLVQIPLTAGRDYQLVALSIDPAETSADAAALKERHLIRNGLAAGAAGIHFLTGEPAAIRAVAERVGFHYRYDPAIKQFAHPAGVVIAAPDGTISRYLLGMNYAPIDLRLGLVEAARGTIAAPASHLLLLCYGYDAVSGRYNLAVHRLLAVAAGLTLLAIGSVIAVAARGTALSRRSGWR